tara:strand:+ start:5052 stop:6005 length:954 start_codon:yes stop_codon:yes gene_type:complete
MTMSNRPNKFNRIPKLTKDGKLHPSEFQPHASMPVWSLALSVLFVSVAFGFFAKNPPIASESLPLERVLAKEHQYLSDSEAVIIGRLGNRNRFDVGVILGARLNETDFSPSMRLQSRVRHAIEGFCYGEIEHLIFSGAAGRKNTDGRKRPSEARAMFEYAKETVEKAPKMRGKRAQEYRCPFELERFSKAKGDERGNTYYIGEDKNGDQFTWVLEEQSYSTKENAELSLNVIQAKEWNSVVVSTSHFHQFRSKGVFQKAIETRKLSKAKVKMLNQVQESSYSRHVDGRERTREFAIGQFDFFRELAAIAYYKMRRWI